LKKAFYGWIIVCVCFLIGITEAGAFQNILAIFMKPMALDFGWNRASISGAIAFGSLFAGIISPFMGPVIDRHGPRMVSFFGIAVLSAGLVGMTFVSRIWQLYLFFGIGRMIAVGVLMMTVSVSVSNWFVRLRGRAMGITWIGSQVGSALLPAFTQLLISTRGWRTAWSALGGVIFLISGIPSLIFLRRRPEDIGLLPDGAPAGASSETHLTGGARVNDSTGGADPLEPVWTRTQAVHSSAFWTLTLLSSLIPFVHAGINFHMYPFLTDQGNNEMVAVTIISTIAVCGAVGSVFWGMFAERLRPQKLLAGNVFGAAVVFLMIFYTARPEAGGILGIGILYVLASLHGLLFGGRVPLLNTIWANFFGRHSLGSIYSISGPFQFTANAIAPIFAALCHDLYGSYFLPFHLFIALLFIIGAIGLFTRPPKSSW